MEPRLLLCAIGIVLGSPTESPAQYDTIVIGLGAAGSAAAGALARGARRVVALEAAPRVGGRVHTVPLADGLVETGAEWIHGNASSVTYELATEHNISLKIQPLTMEAFRSDGSPVDSALVVELFILDFLENPPDPPETYGSFVTRKFMEYITKNKPELLKDQDFIAEFLEFWNLATDCSEGSNDWNDVTTGGDYDTLGGPQAISWHRHGYNTFFDIMLEYKDVHYPSAVIMVNTAHMQAWPHAGPPLCYTSPESMNTYNGGSGLPNLDIKLNTEVTHITTPRHPNETVIVKCRDGSTYVADTAILTVSLGVLKATHATLFSPPLPDDKKSSIEKISMGVVDKIILTFEETWWPQNISMFSFIWKGEDKRKVAAEDSWMTRIYAAHPPMGNSRTLTLWTTGDVAKEVEKLPEETVKMKSVQLLQKFMGDTMKITVPQPVGIIRTTWYSNPFTRGSYSHDNTETLKNPNLRAGLARPLLDSSGAPRVLFAGEATSLRRFSTVHGASDSGGREAKRLLGSK